MLAQLLVVLAVLVAGIVSAVLVDGDSSDESLQTVASVPSAAAAEKTFRSTFALGIEGAGLTITSSGELFVDNVQHAQAGHVRAPGIGSIELRQTGDQLYVRIPPNRVPGKEWISMPASGAGTVSPPDPLQSLQVLAGAHDVTKVGEEDVNGTPTTHYSVVVDPAALKSAVAGDPRAAALPPGVLDQAKDVTTDVWVDDQNRPRRLRVDLKVQAVTVRTAVEFHDYGKPVDVAAPPADQVLTITNPQQLAQLLRGG